ncbi:hypothetical protein [Comamonas jiangduensis]|uniref:hypothetical protein n=1 Tax=Comamonas jiangduensis TaxID=1194168 RepID=UPI003BF7E7E0
MKETGLMFKAPLVRAILEGRKTQTRRLVKPAPAADQLMLRGITTETGLVYARSIEQINSQNIRRIRWESPVGQPGDRIYVRETYFAWGHWETRFSQEKGRDEWHFVDLTLQSGRSHEFYDPLLGKLRRRGQTGPGATWWKRPGILMPKGAARIWLEITGVRVERLQSITVADLAREGIQEYIDKGVDHDGTPRDTFRKLWESTGGDWAANPWVWVIDFKTISTTGRPA